MKPPEGTESILAMTFRSMMGLGTPEEEAERQRERETDEALDWLEERAYR